MLPIARNQYIDLRLDRTGKNHVVGRIASNGLHRSIWCREDLPS